MPSWAVLTIQIAVVLTLLGGFVVSGRVYERKVRRRTQMIRERDIPPFAMWRRRHYPKATSNEIEVIQAVLDALGRLARAEPTQVLPKDTLENFVLERRRPSGSVFGDDDDWSDLLEELAHSIKWHQSDLAPWEMTAYESWETVGDVIDFMSKRTSRARSLSAGQHIA